MNASGTTFLALAAPFLAAAIAPFLHRALPRIAGWLLAIVPALVFVHFTAFIPPVADGQIFGFLREWVPSLGVTLSLRIDGLSLVFALLISAIGTFVVAYSGGYLAGHEHQGRFYSFILLFMGSMQGLVLADDLIALFVFWELTSLTSFLLIGFDHGREAARRAAVQALVVTGAGGLSLLGGIVLIGIATGAGSLSSILAGGDALKQSPYYLSVLLLVLGGAFAKSAQFPLHFWLPNAMEAPTPVSAYLHSATMVKAGVYLLMRLQPALGGTLAWTTILPLFGGATLIIGALLALRQSDLKLMLAYTTVASLGLLVLLTGTSLDAALAAATAYLAAHALFKGALFLIAGAVDHETGTRDISRLAGLRVAMPVTFAAALAAALSMGGLPPFFGFLAKEAMYAGAAGPALAQILVLAALVIGNALMFAIGFAVALKPFLGSALNSPKAAHEAPPALWLGPVVLGLAGLAAGLFAHETGLYFIDPMTRAVTGTPGGADLHLWSGFNGALALSALTIALGLAAYAGLEHGRLGMARVLTAIGWGPDRGFDQLVRGLVLGSLAALRWLQSGRLDVYLSIVFALAAAVILVPLLAVDGLPAHIAGPSLLPHEWGTLALAVIGIVAVLVARTRLTAIVSLGVQGFAVALLFLLFGAPDLSFTQFMVETLSVVILALVMTRLELRKSDHRPVGEALKDGAIAIAGGAAFALLLAAATAGRFDDRLSDFFGRYSYDIAHGRNVVNVIIVDFRGLDTLGEISVVMIAGLSILGLIRLRARRQQRHDPAETGEPEEITGSGETVREDVR